MRKLILLVLTVLATCSVAIAAQAAVNAFAISSQSPGHVTFSVLVSDANSPKNMAVEEICYDANSIPVYDVSNSVGGWIFDSTSNPQGWVGYASFTPPSGLSCFASVHKGGSPQSLASFSYVST